MLKNPFQCGTNLKKLQNDRHKYLHHSVNGCFRGGLRTTSYC